MKYFGGGGGGGGGSVTSFNARTGAVVPVLNDYVASLIGNDSLAPGTTAADALTNVRDVPNADVATTGNVALTGTPANIDAGVTLVTGTTLVLVWLQTNPNENGVYVYNSAGVWVRASVWSTVVNFRKAQPFEILGGTLYGGRIAYVKLSPTVVGSTSIIFGVDLDITSPSLLGQYLFYNPATNKLEPTGIKSALLTDANATIALSTASNFILAIQLTANRTVTLDNTGALTFRVITIDIRVSLAFTLQINNSLGTLYTFAAGSKWLGGFNFSGGQWAGPTGIQEGA